MLLEKIASLPHEESEGYRQPLSDVQVHLERLGGWRHDLPFHEALNDLDSRMTEERAREAARIAKQEVEKAEQANLKDAVRPVLTPPSPFPIPSFALMASLRNGAMEASAPKKNIRRETALDKAVDRFNSGRNLALTSLFMAGACTTLSMISPEHTKVETTHSTPVTSAAMNETSYCSVETPKIIPTSFGTSVETNSNFCKRILQTVPEPSERFTQYDRNTSVRALQDGSFVFRLVTFRDDGASLDKLIELQKKSSVFGSGDRRNAYMDSYAFANKISIADAKDHFYLADKYLRALAAQSDKKSFNENDLNYKDDERVQNALSFRQKNPMGEMTVRKISAEDYKSIVTAWLISPLPFAFYLKKWNLESGMDSDARAGVGTACGINQFTSATFLTVVKLHANELGLNNLYDQVMSISRKHKHRDPVTVRDNAYKAIFNNTCTNVKISAAFGALNTTDKIERLQEMVEAGKITLPFGHTRITEVDGYIGHFLNGNMVTIYRALDKTPNVMMKDLLASEPAVYQRNKGLFEGRTVTEFYQNLSVRYGFGTRTLEVSKWNEARLRNMVNSPEGNYQPVQGIGTKYKIVANDETQGRVVYAQSRPNVNWIMDRYKNADIAPM